MKYFLIEFDRAAARLLGVQEYDELLKAEEAAFGREDELRAQGVDAEVVVLGGESLDALRSSHSAYFLTTEELDSALDRHLGTAEVRLSQAL